MKAWRERQGFSDVCIEALVSGDSCGELAADEELAQRLTLGMTAAHVIGGSLYAEALERFGERSRRLLALADSYYMVRGLLNVFTIPASDHRRFHREV